VPSTRTVVAIALVTLLAGWTWPSPHPSPKQVRPREGSSSRFSCTTAAAPERAGAAITDALTVPTAEFATQMAWLRRAGYHAVGLQRVLAALVYGARLPRRSIAITFDDGYRDVVALSGPDTSFLTWRMLRQLQAYGFAIASHTEHHVELMRIPRRLALQELVRSRVALERALHRRVRRLSYPAGRFDPAVVALARKAGYSLAVTTRPGVVQDGSRPLELRRLEVLDGTVLRTLLPR
jgi:peptidoglycan/xylan/chitin deacetylase (PgdA/CDA1 family)